MIYTIFFSFDINYDNGLDDSLRRLLIGNEVTSARGGKTAYHLRAGARDFQSGHRRPGYKDNLHVSAFVAGRLNVDWQSGQIGQGLGVGHDERAMAGRRLPLQRYFQGLIPLRQFLGCQCRVDLGAEDNGIEVAHEGIDVWP